MNEPDHRKARLRDKLLERRRVAAEANGPAIAARAAERFLESIPVTAGQVVAGYWPMADEIDPRPLLQKLHATCGVRIALPVAAARGAPLVFREWNAVAAPPPGRFGIPAPPETAPPLRPEILLVPLVGFDPAGGRLGLGGGYYDATLAALRQDGAPAPLAVGYAFAVQQVPEIPRERHDQRLDWVVTERRAIRCGEAGQS